MQSERAGIETNAKALIRADRDLVRQLPWLAASGSYTTYFPCGGIGFSREISFASGLFIACQRSQSCCKPSQNSADIPSTRERRKAVSGVTERFPFTISFKRGYETPSRRANSACVNPRGTTNSSNSISPGCVGGRLRGSRRPLRPLVVVCNLDFVGIDVLRALIPEALYHGAYYNGVRYMCQPRQAQLLE